jgi:integrase
MIGRGPDNRDRIPRSEIPMPSHPASRRSYGTGSIVFRRGAYYGKWRAGDRQVMRKLGPPRQPGSSEGLTRKQAEGALRRLMQEVRVASASYERLTVEEVGERYLRHVEHVLERKPTTVADYGSILRRHLAPYFGSQAIERITAEHLAAYMAAKASEGLQTKTVGNHLNFAHGLFSFALKRGWVAANPVAAVDRPRAAGTNPDIRYLDRGEVEALLRAVPDDQLGPTDRVLYLTATMTGLRQGELVALRWQDVDWVAGVVRVRRNYTRGRFGTPKTRRSSRAVPMADRVASELERHFQRSRYQGDEDLVFCHPDTGRPYDASKSRKRFKEALRAAGLRPIRFHDLRHTFGTGMAAAGAPLRAIQEWMGHRDHQTTQVYADYSPDPSQGGAWAQAAFGVATNLATNLSESGGNSEQEKPRGNAGSQVDATP